MSDTVDTAVASVVAPLADELSGLRDVYVDLHRHPELSRQEIRTSSIVADRLARSGYEVTSDVGGTGVVGVLRNGDGPIVALRADMDALPVREQTGLSYASEVVARDPSGRDVPVMHACGHDVHTTCLIGAADLLARAKGDWRGTLMWLAQPAEETITGAREMLRDGLYERFGTPSVVLGQHVAPLPAGLILHRPGPVMAATLSLDVTIHGRGGHGSRPETTIDPVVVGAFIVTRLQTIVSREIEPLQAAVVTVGEFHAGTKSNVIPGEARLAINVRSYDDKVQRHVVSAIERIVRAEADAARCPRPPEITRSYGGPVTSNDAEVVERVKTAHLAWFGSDRVRDMPMPGMGSEDFGLFAHVDGDPESPATIPTGFWFWGGASAEQVAAAPGTTLREKVASLPSNHHPGFMVDPEPTLRTGVEALAVAALAYLDR
ncbi:MAG: amidohydrolase [Ilumatobacteraceae bacterium]